jgi:hypothetical protein
LGFEMIGLVSAFICVHLRLNLVVWFLTAKDAKGAKMKSSLGFPVSLFPFFASFASFAVNLVVWFFEQKATKGTKMLKWFGGV